MDCTTANVSRELNNGLFVATCELSFPAGRGKTLLRAIHCSLTGFGEKKNWVSIPKGATGVQGGPSVLCDKVGYNDCHT